MSLKNLEVKIGADTTGFNRGVKQVQSGVKAMGAGISSLAKMATAFAGISVGIAGVVKAMKDYTVVRNAVQRTNEIFREHAGTLKGFANSALEAFGMSESAAYEYAGIYGNIFSSITTSTEENAKITAAMLKTTAIISSKTGRTIEDVTSRVRSGIMGNTQAIEDLGIVVPVSAIKASRAFQRLAEGRSWEQLTFYEQQQIRTLAIMEQATAKYGNTVSKIEGYSLNRMGSAFRDLTTYAGMFLTAALQPLINAMAKFAIYTTQALKSLASFLGLKLEGKLATPIEGAASAQSSFADETEEANKELKKQQKLLSGFDALQVINPDEGADATAGSGISPFDGVEMPEFEQSDTSWINVFSEKIKGLSELFKNTFAPSLTAWGDAFESIKAPAQQALTKVGDTINDLWENTFEPFGTYLITDFYANVANSFSENIAPIFADTMPVVFDEFAKDAEFAALNIERVVKDIIQPAFEGMKMVATDVFSEIKKAWDTHGTKLLEGFQKFREGIRDTWNKIYDIVIKPVLDMIGAVFVATWTNHIKPALGKFLDMMAELGRGIMDVWNITLKPFIDWLIAALAPVIKFVIGNISTAISGILSTIFDVIGSVLTALKGLIQFLSGVFTGDWKKAWEGVKNIFKGIVEGLWTILKAPINSIIAGINILLRGLNKISFDIPSWVPGIGGKKFGISIPEIPKLAKGAVITKPTTALIGEAGAEAVVPLENNTGWIRQLAQQIAAVNSGEKGVPGAQTIEVYIGNEQLDSYIVRTNSRAALRTNGKGVYA